MYFPIFIDLSDREILMIGGGTIAARRVKSLCGFVGQITVVAPAVCDAIRSLQTEYPVKILQEPFSETMLDDAGRFKKLKKVLLDTGKEKIPMEIQEVRFFKQLVILKFKGIDNINDVEQYRGKSLYVTRENAVKLKKNEYFIADLIGLAVVSDEGEALGTLQDVLQTGANDVYQVEKDGQLLMIPAIKDCILDVDIEQGTMRVHLLDGLRELNR